MLRHTQCLCYAPRAEHRLKFSGWLGLVVLLCMLPRCAGMQSSPRFNEDGGRNGRREKTHARRPAVSSNLFERLLMQQIEAYLGVPYKWGGTTARGMDCSGFVSVVYKKTVNLTLPHNAGQMYQRGQPVTRERLELGDLVFFENIESSGVSHVGIFVGDSKFAHASTTRGVIISGLGEKYYRRRYVGARRVYHE